VFVCENNHYGMSMASDQAFAIENISTRAAAYGFPGVTVDGNDLQEVYEMVTTAVDRARAGRGPTLVENVTYRWKGHSKSDKNLYRTREEIEQWRAQDPILRFEAVTLEQGVLSEADHAQARETARDAVRRAVVEANAAPDARPDDLLEAVFAV
jgi:TPP-dependent pyruvate/acetoin dehydrogenase alpha subunit